MQTFPAIWSVSFQSFVLQLRFHGSSIFRKSCCVSYVVCIALFRLVNTSRNFKITCEWKMAYKRDMMDNTCRLKS
jgi:hypothetical protein